MPATYFVHQRDWTCAVQEDPVIAAIQERLAALEKDINRVIRLAAKEQDSTRQDEFWSIARELQREAREIRKKIS